MWPFTRKINTPHGISKIRNYELLERPLRHKNDDPEWNDKVKAFNEAFLSVDGIVWISFFPDDDGFSIQYDQDVLTPEQLDEAIKQHILWAVGEGYFPFRKHDRYKVGEFYRSTRRRYYNTGF